MSQPRGALQLLLAPDFGSLFWGRLWASVGVWIQSTVAAIVVFRTSGSTSLVGLISVAQFGPQLLLTPLSGAWADRGDPARQILIGRGACAIGSSGLATWFWLRPSADSASTVGAVLVSSLVVGIGFVLGGPAIQSIVHRMVTPLELPTAMALNSTPLTVAWVLGPIAGAFTAAHLGVATAISLAAATHLLFLVLLLVVRLPGRITQTSSTDFSVATAVRHVAHDRPLALSLLGVAAVGFGSEPALTLAPAITQQLGGGTSFVGVLSAGFGCGAAVGLAVGPPLARRRRSGLDCAAGLWLMSIGLLATGAAPTGAVAVGALAGAGLGFATALTGLSTLIQHRAPEPLRGRIMALWLVGLVGARPISGLLLGPISDFVSARAALMIGAALVGLAATACRPSALAPGSESDRVCFRLPPST